MKKNVFLLLIYDKVNSERLWRNYVREVNNDRYSIYVHWKYDKKLSYLDQFRLANTILLLRFKFIKSCFRASVERRIERNEDWNNSAEYRIYKEAPGAE